MAESDGPPRAALIAALVVAVAATVAVLAIVATHRTPQQPIAIAAAAAPHAGDPACHGLLAGLPQRLGSDYQRAPVAQPVPDGVAVWHTRGGPVVLRCGLDRPPEFVVGSPIQVVDSVQWFEVRADGRSTWYTVDRPVYIAVTLPPESGPTPIQQLSDLIDDTITAVPLNPAPVG